MPSAWLRRNVFQPWDGDPRLRAIYLATLVWPIFGDAGLADIDAELEQLAVNTRGTPQRVSQAHLPD